MTRGRIGITETGRTPWRSVTFSGEQQHFDLVPPAGQFIAEVTFAGGVLSILLVDDRQSELTREVDAAEAARFAAELERDARGDAADWPDGS